MNWFDEAQSVAKMSHEKKSDDPGDPIDDLYHFFKPQEADSLYNGGGSLAEDLDHAAKNAMWESTATDKEKKLAKTSKPYDWFNPFPHFAD